MKNLSSEFFKNTQHCFSYTLATKYPLDTVNEQHDILYYLI